MWSYFDDWKLLQNDFKRIIQILHDIKVIKIMRRQTIDRFSFLLIDKVSWIFNCPCNISDMILKRIKKFILFIFSYITKYANPILMIVDLLKFPKAIYKDFFY